MHNLNLQLFALKLNTKRSIVDYMKSTGQDSSYNNRKKIAGQYGINNYTGTSEQNIKLLNMMQKSSSAGSTKSTSGAKNTAGTKNNAATKSATATSNASKSTAKPLVKGTNTTGNGSATVQAANNVLAQKSNAVLDTTKDVKAEKLGTVDPNAPMSYTPMALTDTVVEGKGIVAQTPEMQAQQATQQPPFSNYFSQQAPVYTAPVTNTPTYEQIQTPTYNGQTTQAQQATSMTDRLDANTLATLNSQFQTSQAYQQAMDYTNSLLQKLNGGKTTYTDQISQLISDYQNRDKFAYDSGTDPLFQQALSSAMRSGKTAMQDTMGQAAALTGGYGSTYAQSVGNSAYNQYLQEAYDMMPEYYQLALDAYNQEGSNLLNQISLLDSQDSKEYDRLYNAYNANYGNAQNLYNQEFNTWQGNVNNAYNYAGLLNSDYWNQLDYAENIRQYDQNFGYQQYQDSLNQTNFENQFNYQQYQDQINQGNIDRDFSYQQYLDALNQYNTDRNFGWMQSEADRDQGNIDWEHNWAQDEANREQGNIDRDFDYTAGQDKIDNDFRQNESDREQGNIDRDFDYNAGQDSIDNQFRQDEANREQGNIDRDFNYNAGQDEIDNQFRQDESNREQGNIDRDFNYNAGQDKIDNEFRQNESDWEHQYTEDAFAFEKEQAGIDNAFTDREITLKENQTAKENEFTERELKIREEQAKRAVEESKIKTEESGEEYNYKTPSEKMFTSGLSAAVQGGEAALISYCDTIGEYDGFAIVDYCQKKLTFTKSKETINGGWNLDHNDEFVDGYGQTYTLDEIADSLGLSKAQLTKLTKLEKGATLDLFSNLD